MHFINTMLLCDGYKTSHKEQYPPCTTLVYSNFTPRKSRVEGVDHMVFFGLQYAIQEYLINHFNQNFFWLDEDEAVDEYKKYMDAYLGPDSLDVSHIRDLHKLGYLPLHIKAVKEGTKVPLQTPCMTLYNTKPEFFWVTNYVETLLSALLWKPCTSATTALEFKRIFTDYANETGGNLDFIPFQGHDFSFRGMSGVEDAVMSGAGHLLSFVGTDTIPAINFLERYYGADISKELVGCSVPASEHSCLAAGSKDNEKETISRLLDTYPKGVFSLVSDTWDLFKLVNEYLPALKDKIMSRDGKLVCRPDCYSDDTEILTKNGWKLFSELNDKDLVAQVNDNEEYEFVKPTKIIKQKYKGKMYHFHDIIGKLDFVVTPNHRMVYKKNNKLSTVEAEDAKFYYQKNLVRSASAKNQNKSLTYMERLMIAFQADGSYPSNFKKRPNEGIISNKRIIRFSFAKQRKVDRLAEICNKGGITYEISEYPYRPGQKVFTIWLDKDTEIYKDFRWVDTSNLCSNWCKEFLEELSHWDATIRNSGRTKFDTTVKEVVDVVELICMSAGYGVFVSRRSDDRKDHFSDVFTAHILKTNILGGQAVQKTEVDYDGYVYCVTVPTGKIIVKRHRSTLICGNSGTPHLIVNGDPNSTCELERMGVLRLLDKHFGSTVNDKGFKELDPHVGLIYGDGIDRAELIRILEGMKQNGYASTNIVIGLGSYTYEYVTRDTFGTVCKATYVEVDGEPRPIWKSPKTGAWKNSHKGLLRVNADLTVDQDVSWAEEKEGILNTVFFNGTTGCTQSLSEIREHLKGQL